MNKMSQDKKPIAHTSMDMDQGFLTHLFSGSISLDDKPYNQELASTIH